MIILWDYAFLWLLCVILTWSLNQHFRELSIARNSAQWPFELSGILTLLAYCAEELKCPNQKGFLIQELKPFRISKSKKMDNPVAKLNELKFRLLVLAIQTANLKLGGTGVVRVHLVKNMVCNILQWNFTLFVVGSTGHPHTVAPDDAGKTPNWGGTSSTRVGA